MRTQQTILKMPSLVAWSGALTPDGEAVSAWLNLVGIPVPPAPDGSLLKPIALYLRGLSEDERARLWAQFQAATIR